MENDEKEICEKLTKIAEKHGLLIDSHFSFGNFKKLYEISLECKYYIDKLSEFFKNGK